MPIISSLILTNQLPMYSYTASVLTSGSVIADGLGNQITSLQLTSSYVSASGVFGGLTRTLYVVSASGALNYITMSFVNGVLISATP